MSNPLEEQLASMQAGARAAEDEVLVPANALVLTPCWTRDALIQGLDPATADRVLAASDAMATFDDLGCRIDPVSGFRLPDDCRTVGQGETRSLCPGVAREYHSDVGVRFLSFAKSAAPVLSAVAPVLGPAMANALAPVIADIAQKLGITGASFFGDIMKRFTKWLGDGVKMYFGSDLDALKKAAKATFQALGVTAKSLADLMKKTIVGGQTDVATILAYANHRDGASVAAAMLKNHAPTVELVKGVAADSVHAVVDYASARIRRDGLKMLGGLQGTVTAVLDARGAVTPEILANLLGTAAHDGGLGSAVKSMSESEIARFALSGFSLDASVASVSAFAGKPEAMIRAFDPTKLALLIPGVRERYDFVQRALDARAIDLMLEPFVTEAEQALGRHFDAVRAELRGAGPPPVDVRARMARSKLIRDRIRAANDEADQIVKRGLALYDPREAGRR